MTTECEGCLSLREIARALDDEPPGARIGCQVGVCLTCGKSHVTTRPNFIQRTRARLEDKLQHFRAARRAY